MVSVTSQKSIVVITFLATDQNRISRTEGETGAIFHIWLDTELVTLISGVHLETVVTV